MNSAEPTREERALERERRETKQAIEAARDKLNRAVATALSEAHDALYAANVTPTGSLSFWTDEVLESVDAFFVDHVPRETWEFVG